MFASKDPFICLLYDLNSFHGLIYKNNLLLKSLNLQTFVSNNSCAFNYDT